MSDREGYLQRRDQLLMQDEEIAELKAELAAIKKKARAAVNAPYDDILDMGLAQALRKLKQEIEK